MNDKNSKVVIEKSAHDAILLERENAKREANGQKPKVAEVVNLHENVENVFPFDYEEFVLFNKDADVTKDGEQSFSRYRVVFGDNGKIINCAKNSYTIVPTLSVSSLAQAFKAEGLNVFPFVSNNGAKIGLKVVFGNRPSKVGECQYSLIVTVPNDGTGMGYLSVEQLRLICGNGQTRKSRIYKDNNIKIPHTFKYEEAIELMKASIQTYGRLLNELENRDIKMAEMPLKETEVMYHLNKWFFEQELPVSQKTLVVSTDLNGNVTETRKMELDDFRRLLVTDNVEIPSKARYDELQEALKRELEYNKELGLDLSMYTVFAATTNYLSRRVEKSGSQAPSEIKNERASAKLSYFDKILAEGV